MAKSVYLYHANACHALPEYNERNEETLWEILEILDVCVNLNGGSSITSRECSRE